MKPTDEQIAEWLSRHGFERSALKGRMWCLTGKSIIHISDFAELYEAVHTGRSKTSRDKVNIGAMMRMTRDEINDMINDLECEVQRLTVRVAELEGQNAAPGKPEGSGE